MVRVEEVGVLRRAALDEAVIGEAHPQRADVRAEAALQVMVLAVDVAGDHSAERHVLRSRCDGREETSREDQPVQLCERESCLCAENVRLRIEGEDPVGHARRHHAAPSGGGSELSPYERPRPRDKTACSLSRARSSDFTSRPGTGMRPQPAIIGSCSMRRAIDFLRAL